MNYYDEAELKEQQINVENLEMSPIK